MATFNILSSCICRDAFGFQENCGHEIITFLQSTSPFTWFEFNQTPKRLLVPECFSDINIKNFRKRNGTDMLNKAKASKIKTLTKML